MVRFILALLGIYLEESGVPMPVPSEISIAYIAHVLHPNPAGLIIAWVGLTVLIVFGSTNLFLLSRRFGPRFLHGRVGQAVHLTPDRIVRATRWFHRWGPLAIVIARFVPGLRWAMAVTCGTLGVSLRTYWISSALAAAIWSGLLLTIGATVGDAVAQVLVSYPWLLVLLPIPALSVVAISTIRLFYSRRAASFPIAARSPIRHISGPSGA